MITQIGISMIVPIFVGAFLGYQLDQWLGTGFLFLVFLAFGIAAAFRNIYKLTKPFYAADLKREQAEQAYWDSLKKARGEEEGTSPPPAETGFQKFPKTRREMAEEEFAAWRRKKEKEHDGM